MKLMSIVVEINENYEFRLTIYGQLKPGHFVFVALILSGQRSIASHMQKKENLV